MFNSDIIYTSYGDIKYSSWRYTAQKNIYTIFFCLYDLMYSILIITVKFLLTNELIIDTIELATSHPHLKILFVKLPLYMILLHIVKNYFTKRNQKLSKHQKTMYNFKVYNVHTNILYLLKHLNANIDTLMVYF